MLLYPLSVFVLGGVATPIAILALRRRGVLDVPNRRSSHTSVTVRGAGIGVAIVAVAAGVIAGLSGERELLFLALAAACCAVLGFLDDLRSLAVSYRLAGQVLIACLAVALLLPGRPLLFLPAVIGIVGYLNAFNFMDGINGISGLHALAIGTIWVAGGLALDVQQSVFLGGVLAAAAAGFLPYNFPRAKAFLGDVGSYFFGGWIAVSAVLLFGAIPTAVILAPLLPYAADTGWTLVRRVRRGDNWHEAHREHVYQRVVSAGWGHPSTAILVGSLTLLCGLLGLVVGGIMTESQPAAVAALFAIAVALLGYLVLPERLERSRGRRSSVS